MEKIETITGKQGAGATKVFAGDANSPIVKQMYAESAPYIAELVRLSLEPRQEHYDLLDIGSFRGELLCEIMSELKDGYSFHTIGLDVDEDALALNAVIDQKIIGDASRIPLADKSVDIAIVRYVLQWNSEEKQKQIIKELNRVCRRFSIVQHAGAERADAGAWQAKMHQLVFGGMLKVSRPEGYFSSPSEVEEWMTELGIRFQTLQERTLENVSRVFAEKYNLTGQEILEVKNILGDKDYIHQTTWIIGEGVQPLPNIQIG